MVNGHIYVSFIPGERPRYQKKSTHPAPVRGSDDRNVIWAGIETSNGRTERPEKDGWASKAGNLGGMTGGDAIILILCGVCLCHPEDPKAGLAGSMVGLLKAWCLTLDSICWLRRAVLGLGGYVGSSSSYASLVPRLGDFRSNTAVSALPSASSDVLQS